MEVDLAWCAGLFDGEGSTSVLKTQRDKYSYIRLSLSQKDRRVLDKFKTIMSFGKIYKATKREIHSYDVYKQEEVIEVLNKMWPYLSEIKKLQAIKAYDRVFTKEYNEIFS